MHLKHLVLNGYKTFANKTAFDFTEGVTAVIGPNGSGKCVTGDTPIVLADGRNVPIRQLVETALVESRCVEVLDDGALTRNNPQNIHVLSLNPDTLRLEPRPVAGFVRRRAPASLLQIRSRTGREITATAYHPLFTLKNGHLHALRADELKVGTRVALPRQLPVAGQPVTFPLLDVLGKLKGEDHMTIQALRFPKSDGWTLEKAKEWVKSHPVKSFDVLMDLDDGINIAEAYVEVLEYGDRTVIEQRSSSPVLASMDDIRSAVDSALKTHLAPIQLQVEQLMSVLTETAEKELPDPPAPPDPAAAGYIKQIFDGLNENKQLLGG
ncbi:MAG: hypothetical protein M1546_25640 [Chloroflexi bacterium]|nr:hypothetical protein [Chloroflexota bacterium]